MGLNDGLADGQAHAQPFRLGGEEAIEEALDRCRIQSRAGVFHLHQNCFRIASGMDAQKTGPVRDSIHRIEAIDHQIHEDLLDLYADLPDLSGLDLQCELTRKGVQVPIVFLTGHGSIPMSVRAVKAGAVEFLTKPVDCEALVRAVREGLRSREYSAAAPREVGGSDIVGTSAGLRGVLKQIGIVAPTESTVLILGETGVGKELIAREIHRRSRRQEHPLVRVNCASIPKELYESEFFGHVKGAFTGALRDRAGRFEAAQGGTLFLDEVGEIPLDLQSKLLRALQDKQYERVGDDRTRRADVRIVAATNRDLKGEVEAGVFARTSTTGSMSFPCKYRPCASAARMFLSSRSTLSNSS